MTSTLGVIPARYAASRFPGKPLKTLWGKPMLQHVWERASAVQGMDALVVATDDDRIASAARGFGAEVELTSTRHESGTDRVAEVARRKEKHGIVLNLQGDEPELDSDAVARLIEAMKAHPDVKMGTLAHEETDAAVLAAKDVVKVIVDGDGFALYFGRAQVAPGSPEDRVLRHAGVYAFRRKFLLEFASWSPGTQERAERLEQLRALEHGVRIKVVTGARAFAGVDTPQQLEALERRGPRP